ncbi:MAG: hypothetical protein Kow00124_18180 [Anaerolineae bacterium]
MNLVDKLLSPVGVIAIMAAFWVVLGAFVLLIMRANRRRAAELRAAAEARGWSFEDLREGRRLITRWSGVDSDGRTWTIESISVSSSSSSGSVSTQTIWRSEAARLDDAMILIGPSSKNMPALDLGSGMAQFVLRVLIQHILPDAAVGDEKLLASLRLVELGSESLREHYMVLTTDEEIARGFLEGGAERALIDYAMQVRQRDLLPQVAYWERGLQIKVNRRLSRLVDLERLAALGEVLAGSVSAATIWDE